MADGVANLVARATVTASAHQYRLGAAALVGRAHLVPEVLRTATARYIGEYENVGALPSTGIQNGDWATFPKTDSTSQYRAGARRISGVWVEGKAYEQGPALAGASTSWRWEDGGTTYPARYWDGTGTGVANQKFSVDASGNVVIAGSLAAGSIDVPSSGATGFHVNSSGGVNLGGTTASGVAAGDMNVAGTITLVGAGGTFRTAASGARAELGSGQLRFRDANAISSAAQVFGTDETLAISSPMVGASPPTMASITLIRNATQPYMYLSADSIHLIPVATNGPFVEMAERSAAPGTPSPNRIFLYVKDKSGVSALYYKNDAGTEVELGAGGSGSVATDAIWDVKGDLALGTGANTASRLAVGADDTILMADSAASTGAKWVAAGTPSTQAFGDTAVVGTADTFTRGDHKHAMPAAPIQRSLVHMATQANSAASQTNVIISVDTVGASLPVAGAGSLTGISVGCSAARTAGSLAVEVYKNGVATGLIATIDATNTQWKTTTQAAGLDTFVSGDRLDVRVTTSATWLPITNDVIVGVYAEWTS